jgi:hypothetical protein
MLGKELCKSGRLYSSAVHVFLFVRICSREVFLTAEPNIWFPLIPLNIYGVENTFKQIL